MFNFLPEAVRRGIDDARRADQRRAGRLSIQIDDQVHRILALWDNGLALDASHRAPLRGLVDIFDGPRHLYQCLLVTSREEDGQRIYDFKWIAHVSETRPLDFAQQEETPLLLPYH
ncbi:hypothetical protein [Ketogulonicigenium vulgare]|uniref:Uncharacterized protein n=1 Tax=Ketogulonicigenium vulgare (strain WSH-001) TaxID=759362 RepID=F9Y8K4_KETVW|nr:hypothetical protein [Ketogulonicigenium vulgare]ADO41779.1 conserved hypothetical protein [Ketogulonicigenium vulgare Y25]AEM40013.1 hypothetical protein KVU_0174 [Ketogulonicigenium vulgare WSH-001]ALJ82237.1 hypothetical protein KVH_02920 [Ketogulonicigenium vulgare]ANW34894.1 hypothetical protein KvSKV_02915 [Ketogulonicigenium vulgare]AOZ53711.1 hypothetical protein KVC_0687 [Ketogulonicigenium vulgare]